MAALPIFQPAPSATPPDQHGPRQVEQSWASSPKLNKGGRLGRHKFAPAAPSAFPSTWLSPAHRVAVTTQFNSDALIRRRISRHPRKAAMVHHPVAVAPARQMLRGSRRPLLAEARSDQRDRLYPPSTEICRDQHRTVQPPSLPRQSYNIAALQIPRPTLGVDARPFRCRDRVSVALGRVGGLPPSLCR